MSKVLIELDHGFMARIERERFVAEYAHAAALIEEATARADGKPPANGKRPARTATMRTLLREAMDARCLARGESIPTAEELAASEPVVVEQSEAQAAPVDILDEPTGTLPETSVG